MPNYQQQQNLRDSNGRTNFTVRPIELLRFLYFINFTSNHHANYKTDRTIQICLINKQVIR